METLGLMFLAVLIVASVVFMLHRTPASAPYVPTRNELAAFAALFARALEDSCALPGARPFLYDLRVAVRSLDRARTPHERAEQHGPFNRDLSGYGVMSWKGDLYDRDDALREAWEPIERINRTLTEHGLGWRA